MSSGNIEILDLFHHIHHEGNNHVVHHCGGKHVEINHKLNYNIVHCQCGKHGIDKNKAIGHDFNLSEIEVLFTETCPEGGWHLESGKIKNHLTIDKITALIHEHRIKNSKKSPFTKSQYF